MGKPWFGAVLSGLVAPIQRNVGPSLAARILLFILKMITALVAVLLAYFCLTWMEHPPSKLRDEPYRFLAYVLVYGGGSILLPVFAVGMLLLRKWVIVVFWVLYALFVLLVLFSGGFVDGFADMGNRALPMAFAHIIFLMTPSLYGVYLQNQAHYLR